VRYACGVFINHGIEGSAMTKRTKTADGMIALCVMIGEMYGLSELDALTALDTAITKELKRRSKT
jgi:hypothetical protein